MGKKDESERLRRYLEWNDKEALHGVASADPQVATFSRLFYRLGNEMNVWIDEEARRGTPPALVANAAMNFLVQTMAAIFVALGQIDEDKAAIDIEHTINLFPTALRKAIEDQVECRAQIGEGDPPNVN